MKSMKWFNLGADALARIAPDLERCYICPLCLRMLTPQELAGNPNLLSREHVPPEALGGSPICLTCRDCNSRAGRELDVHWQARLEQIRFAQGTMQRAIQAHLTRDGKRISARVLRSPGSILIWMVPAASDPSALSAYSAHLDQQIAAGQTRFDLGEISVGRGCRRDPAQVAELRAAYLSAFALFGYSFALRPALDIIRSQIAAPETRMIRSWSATVPDSADDVRLVVGIQRPSDMRSLMVQMGKSVVFLPGRVDDDGLYDRLADRAKADPTIPSDLGGIRYPWPKQPKHLLDFSTHVPTPDQPAPHDPHGGFHIVRVWQQDD